MSRQPARGTVTKRKLTVAQAADQFEKARKTIDKTKPLLEEAAEVLKEHFAKTGRTTYKDRIALVTNAGRLVLDQAKVRAYLGKRLGEFQKRTQPSTSLALLDPERAE
jgi:hypothetical protein